LYSWCPASLLVLLPIASPGEEHFEELDSSLGVRKPVKAFNQIVVSFIAESKKTIS
jgi:hypothetical protein